MKAKSKKSVTRERKTQKKPNGLPQCPSLLIAAMELINLAPLETEWPEEQEMLTRAAGGGFVRLADLIQSHFPEWPFRKWKDPDTVCMEYFYLTGVRGILNEILREPVFRRLTKYGADSVRCTDLQGIELHGRDWPEVKAQLAVDPETFKITLKPPRHRLIQTFLGVDVRYVRACVICGRVFWAKREKSTTCGIRCDATRRQRLRRTKKRQDAESSVKKRQMKKTRKAEK